jgi:hypothetical protein
MFFDISLVPVVPPAGTSQPNARFSAARFDNDPVTARAVREAMSGERFVSSLAIGQTRA